MIINKISLVFICTLIALEAANAQTEKVQQGMLIKNGTDVRLGGIQVINKRNLDKAKSNIYGVFKIAALAGDTLEFLNINFQNTDFVVSDFTDKILYLQPAIELNEVVVRERSIQEDIKEVQRGYRSKSVFYTGNPHYYYLVLKPMTFIYENFKSEVIDARRFNKYARREMASIKVAERFNDNSIKAVTSIKDEELEGFKDKFTPTLQQLNMMNDFDLVNYIRKSYDNFKSSKIN